MPDTKTKAQTTWVHFSPQKKHVSMQLHWNTIYNDSSAEFTVTKASIITS